MRLNELLEREIDLAVFGLATGHTRFRQVVHHSGKHLGIRSVTDTQQVVKALHGGAMHVGKRRYWHRNGRAPDVVFVHVGGALYQLAGILLADAQQYVDRELAGGVLRASEDRHIQKVEDRMTHLVGRCEQELPDHGIGGCDSVVRTVISLGNMSGLNSSCTLSSALRCSTS